MSSDSVMSPCNFIIHIERSKTGVGQFIQHVIVQSKRSHDTRIHTEREALLTKQACMRAFECCFYWWRDHTLPHDKTNKINERTRNRLAHTNSLAIFMNL